MIDNYKNKDKRISICGGGLVGCLAACYFAKRDFDVTLYEYRSDIRKAEIVIEMYSRMIHDIKGDTEVVPYGKDSECILSIDRRFLNELLLTGIDF